MKRCIATLLSLLLVVDALNVTRFDTPGHGKRGFVVSTINTLQWTVTVDCSLTWEEVMSVYRSIRDDPVVPCTITLAAQSSASTLMVVLCEDNEMPYGPGISSATNVVASTTGLECAWTVVRDGVVRTSSTTQAVGSFWHLDRLDRRALQQDSLYTYERDGTGVTVFVLDTGCNYHQDFASRLVERVNHVGDGIDGDGNGHGTYCAGLAVGTQSGVAKNATLICMKVLDSSGSGSFSTVMLAGMDIVDRHSSEPTAKVVSMSLAGGYYAPINTLVNDMVNTHRIAVVVAAGNSAANVINFSPASASAALTVAASELYTVNGVTRERLAGYSNRGTSIDVAGPGSSVRGPNYAILSAFTTKSGTSATCPIAAGVAALILQQQALDNETVDGLDALATLKSMATIGLIDDANDSYPAYPMLFSSVGVAPVPQPPPAPPAPPAPPMAPPQSNWLAPFSRPASAGGNEKLLLSFIAHPLFAITWVVLNYMLAY